MSSTKLAHPCKLRTTGPEHSINVVNESFIWIPYTLTWDSKLHNHALSERTSSTLGILYCPLKVTNKCSLSIIFSQNFRSLFCKIICISMTYWGKKLNINITNYFCHWNPEMSVFTPPAALERPHCSKTVATNWYKANATNSNQWPSVKREGFSMNEQTW